jgi:hypothetical protein
LTAQRRQSGGQAETAIGFNFNYYFGMSRADLFAPAMVNDLRTVDGSRHGFVERQYEKILKYREATKIQVPILQAH